MISLIQIIIVRYDHQLIVNSFFKTKFYNNRYQYAIKIRTIIDNIYIVKMLIIIKIYDQ